MLGNNNVKLANLRMLEFVATKLGDIRNDVVFLGGCTTGLKTPQNFKSEVYSAFLK